MQAAAQAAEATRNPFLLMPMPFSAPNPAAAGPEDGQPRNKEWAAVLQQFVRMITGYAPLKFVPFYVLKKHGEDESNTPRRWRTILGMAEIQYLPEDVDDPDQRVSLAKAAHEAWHVVFSRPELIFDHPEFVESMAFQALWWSIEDVRVNVLGMNRHSGTKPWIDLIYEREYAVKDLDAERAYWKEKIPLHLQFNYALIYEWATGQRDPRVGDRKVHDALDRAAKFIKGAYSASDARRSFEIIRTDIWPIYKELIDEAYEREQQKQKKGQKGQQGQQGQQSDQDQDSQDQDQDQDSDSQQQGKPGQQGKQGKPGKQKQKPQDSKNAPKDVKDKMEKMEREQRDKNASKMIDDPKKMSQSEREKMKKELEKMREKMGEKDKNGQQEKQQGQQGQQKGQKDGQPGEGEGQGEKSDAEKQSEAQRQAKQRERLSKADEREKQPDARDEENYQDYFKRISRLVPVMRQQFMQVLKRKIRRRTIKNRRSGDLDEESINELPAGKADPFEESISVNKALYRVSLLIDTSSSMSGDKREKAIEGAVLLMETLEKLPGVKYEIVAFDSQPRVIKSYGERVTPAVKVAVVKALLRGSGSTESHVAVQQAIERIRMGKGEKLMIMVNDGDPDYNFSREQYRAMVEAAKDIDIHGVGLGADAQLVLDLFPPGRGWWLKDAADFAKNLRAIIKKKILGNMSNG